MKHHFDFLAPLIIHKTQAVFNWQEEERAQQFKKHILLQEKKEIHVTSSGWISEHNNASLRYARFQNEQIDIATMVLFPTNNPKLFPIFVVELVLVMDKIHRCIIDVEPVDNLIYPWKNRNFLSFLLNIIH